MHNLWNSLTIWSYNISGTYNVNPLIYAALYVLSIPPFWYGILQMAKSLVKSRRKHLVWREAVQDTAFNFGLSVTAFAWALPVVYLIGWGRNLPFWIYSLTIVSVFLFILSLHKNIVKRMKILEEKS